MQWNKSTLSYLIKLTLASVLFLGSASHAATKHANTLDIVRSKGYIMCGVNTGLLGLSAFDSQGVMKGLDVDVCHAIAAAVFGDRSKVKFKPLSAAQRFTALQSGDVDVLTRNTTRTLGRDTSLGLNFGPINYYDGQRFMVHKDLGVSSSKELDQAALCIQQGTTTELNAADFFRTEGITFKPVVYEDINELKKAFFAGRCDAYTGDGSEMAAIRMESGTPQKYIILPEVISKEPLAPVVRHGDDQWLDIVTYSFYAMVYAEELGISSSNVVAMQKSNNPKIKRFLGVTAGNGVALGLSEDFAFHVVKQVGNYGESFQRHISGPLGLDRGLNKLWTDGGLMYAPPFK